VRPGDKLTFIWIDERLENPYAAVSQASMSPAWAALPRTGFAVGGAGGAAAAAAEAQREMERVGAGGYESTMAGFIGPPSVVPQHYIARLVVIARAEPAAAAGAPSSSGRLQCCCIPSEQLISNSDANPRAAELRSLYRKHPEDKPYICLRRTPAGRNNGTELWEWGVTYASTVCASTGIDLTVDELQCGSFSGMNVNCG